MNAVEFDALTAPEPARPVWCPTDEDLVELFWSPAALAYLDRLRVEADDRARVRRSAYHDALAPSPVVEVSPLHGKAIPVSKYDVAQLRWAALVQAIQRARLVREGDARRARLWADVAGEED